jgi:hypothetical protein
MVKNRGYYIIFYNIDNNNKHVTKITFKWNVFTRPWTYDCAIIIQQPLAASIPALKDRYDSHMCIYESGLRLSGDEKGYFFLLISLTA